jgi:large subunit ribosomal protein L35
VPKVKSNRGATKRFKVTSTGKIRRLSSHHSHILTKKTRKRKRQLRSGKLVDGSDLKRVRRML